MCRSLPVIPLRPSTKSLRPGRFWQSVAGRVGPGQGSPGLVLPDHLHPARIGKPWPAFVGLVLTPCHPATWPRHIRRDMCWPTLQLSAESLTLAPLRTHRRLRQNSEVQCLFTKHLNLSSRRHSTLRACSSPPTYHHVCPPLLTSCPTQPALRIFLR